MCGRSATGLLAAILHDIDASRLSGHKVAVLTNDVTQAFSLRRPPVVETNRGKFLRQDNTLRRRTGRIRLSRLSMAGEALSQADHYLSPILLTLYVADICDGEREDNYANNRHCENDSNLSLKIPSLKDHQ